jgi:16S rRNA (adenine1518-N6/adenine1519-N6)-dimethyltransferase
MNLLAAMLQGWAEPKMVTTVPRGAFIPSPKVDSALLTLEPTGKIPREELTRYFETVKKFFRHPRKTLANNLREGFSLTGARAGMLVRTLGHKETARAAELTPEHVKMLIKMVYN